MARPKKDNPRTEVLQIRLTPDEMFRLVLISQRTEETPSAVARRILTDRGYLD